MGCALSGLGVTAVPEEERCPSPEGKLDPETKPEGVEVAVQRLSLSEAQKELIRTSWQVLHKDIARVGIIVFIRPTKNKVVVLHPLTPTTLVEEQPLYSRAQVWLFETHPECKDAFFLFREIDDLRQLKMNKELQAHGLRVMSFIEKSVARLGQEEKLERLSLELGRSHWRYKAPPKYYEYVGTQFIKAAQPILKEEWTPEVEKAWENLFTYMAVTMKRGFYEEEKAVRENQALDLRKGDVESTPNQI